MDAVVPVESSAFALKAIVYDIGLYSAVITVSAVTFEKSPFQPVGTYPVWDGKLGASAGEPWSTSTRDIAEPSCPSMNVTVWRLIFHTAYSVTVAASLSVRLMTELLAAQAQYFNAE